MLFSFTAFIQSLTHQEGIMYFLGVKHSTSSKNDDDNDDDDGDDGDDSHSL